jgi:ribulose-5-phosphate 4-epimerase/fuculose-1-phosphate aldolase
MTAETSRNRPEPQQPAAERVVRRDLAAFYRLAARYGWDDLVLAHISARVPGEDAYLINPFGLLFSEITASNLLKVGLAGRKLCESPFGISPEANILRQLERTEPDFAT